MCLPPLWRRLWRLPEAGHAGEAHAPGGVAPEPPEPAPRKPGGRGVPLKDAEVGNDELPRLAGQADGLGTKARPVWELPMHGPKGQVRSPTRASPRGHTCHSSAVSGDMNLLNPILRPLEPLTPGWGACQ